MAMSGMATVVNMQDRPDLRAALDGTNEHGDVVRIDRRSRWGNPFIIGRHGTREEVIERYRNWLWSKMKSGAIPLSEVAALNGKTLLCHCHPLPCHGDVLAKAASWAHARLTADMSWQPGERIEATIGPAPIYAGVGARKTPEPVLNVMRKMATSLAGRGWQLRTGGARGADDAFARAAPTARRTVYIPWRGYNGWSEAQGRALTAQELRTLRAAAAPHHPAWQRCPGKVRDLHARNVAILIGVNMREPVHAMVCWTEGGRVEGGTGMAIRLARHYRIPILNLASIDMRAAMDRLDRTAQTRGPRELERNLGVSGGTTDDGRSVTSARSQRDKRDEDWWMAEGAQQVRTEEPREMTRQHSLHL